ncbi:MAG: outer membrane protein [Ferruginibacter sp.]|nr:outer membrane protein [Ferruginibacter sp.]
MHRVFFGLLVCLYSTMGMAQQRSMNYFVDAAVEQSPLLKDLHNQVTAQKLDSLLIRATQRTQANFTSNDSYAPVINGYGYDEAITNIANVSALFGVTKSLSNGPNNKLQFANIRLLADAAKNNLAVSEQDIRKTIINQYLITYGDLLQLNFNRELQDMLSKQEEVLKKLTQKNVYKQVDYLTFIVTLQQNNFKLKQQENIYRNDYATLNYLAGIVDSNYVALEEPEMNLDSLPDFASSVFNRKYTIDSLSLATSKALLDINYKPKLNVFADAGYNSSLQVQPYRNFGWSAGLSLVVPLYDGGQKKIQYDKIALQEDTRRANQAFYNNQYRQQIAQLRQQLDASTALIADINEQLKYIQTLIKVHQQLLQTGEVRIYDYILALNNYLNTKTMVNENTVSRWMLINQLNYWNR